MKNWKMITLSAMLTLCLGAKGQETPRPSISQLIPQEIVPQPARTVSIDGVRRGGSKGVFASASSAKVEQETARKGWGAPRGWRALRKLAEETAYDDKLDSIVGTVHSTGLNVERITYTYYDNCLPKLMRRYRWNATDNRWDDIDDEGYTWNDNGYCVEQWVIYPTDNAGMKYEYTYNERNLGISQTAYTYNNGEWKPSGKGEYEYDDYGNVTDEKVFSYDDNTGNWVPYAWNKATWTSSGLQTHLERYTWDGTQWQGSTPMNDFEYNADGLQTLASYYMWQEDTRTWLNYYKLIQDYDKGHLTLQQQLYWNKTRQDWSGAEDYLGATRYNDKTILEYDEKMRETHELYSKADTNGEYVKRVEFLFTYTDSTDGSYKGVCNQYFYDETGENDSLVGDLEYHWNAKGQLLYERGRNYANDKWTSRYENINNYDDNGNTTHTEEYRYNSDEANTKLAYAMLDMEYDSHNNMTKRTGYIGLGGGADDWYNTKVETFAYEQDTVLVENLVYKPTNGVDNPDSGIRNIYDFDTPVASVALWVGPRPYHITKEQQLLFPKDNDWDYNSYKFYYSEVDYNAIRGIATDDANGLVSLSGDRVNILAPTGEPVAVFTADGTEVCATKSHSINVSGWAPGLYIVKAGSATAKFAIR